MLSKLKSQVIRLETSRGCADYECTFRLTDKGSVVLDRGTVYDHQRRRELSLAELGRVTEHRYSTEDLQGLIAARRNER